MNSTLNTKTMRLHTLVPVLLLALAACKQSSNKKDVNVLKEQKTKLEKELAAVTAEIKALEKASGKITVQQKTAHVTIEKLQPITFQHYIEVQGKVTSDNNANISAKTAGEIKRIYVKKGQSVKKGTLLASIDVNALTKGRDELKTGLEFATQVYEKQKGLWDQKIGTEIQFLQAKNNKESLEAKLATLNEQIAFGSVVAPASGVIEEVYPKEGETAAPGAPMFRLIGQGESKITADISEAYSSLVKEGNQAEVFFPGLNKTIQTTVKVVGDEISATNRTFNVDLRLPNVPGVKSNMIAYVRIKDYEAKKTLQVPVSTIQKAQEGNFVFVAKDGKAAKQIVKTGKTYKGLAEVLDGLKPGMELITSGHQDLIEGQPVQF